MAPLVVILAGGESRRMGGGKPLRQLGGETLIERAVRLAGRWSDDVRLALRSSDQVPGASLPVLLDGQEIGGPLAGLASALSAAKIGGRTHVLTLPCDMPFLPADLCARLAEAIGDHGVAIAASDGQLHPVCALWSTDASGALDTYRSEGRRSLKGLAERVGMVAVEWPAELFVNLNTPEELAAAELRLRSEVENRD